MKPYRNLKIIITFAILMLLGCDITLLFAAQSDSDANASSTQQQLQQIQSLQQQNAAASSYQGSSSANQAASPVQSQPASQSSLPPLIPTVPAAASAPQVQQAPPQPLPAQQALPASTNDQTQAPQSSYYNAPPQDQGAVVTSAPPDQNAPPADQTVAAPQPVPAQGQGLYDNTQGNGAVATPAPAQPTADQTSADADNSGMVSEDSVRDDAFNAMTQNQLPMSPEQIQKLRSLFNQSQYAAATMPGVPPRPTVTSQFVNLSPGSTAPVIRLAQGFVTSLVFIDSTGAPWPIAAYDIGNPSAFNIQWNHSDNTLMIQALTLYTYGNLAVRLQGLPTPVMLTLIPGQKAVDYRVDLRIQGNGPNAIPVPVTGLPSSANPELLGVLDGIPPEGSAEIQIEGGCAQAWVRGNQLFVRTHYTILSPGWTSTMSSADGMKAYQMPKAPLLLASANGKIIQLKLEGF